MMPLYRIYALGKDGRYLRRTELFCTNDDEVIAQAQLRLDGEELEIWQLGRLVKKLRPGPLTTTTEVTPPKKLS